MSSKTGGAYNRQLLNGEDLIAANKKAMAAGYGTGGGVDAVTMAAPSREITGPKKDTGAAKTATPAKTTTPAKTNAGTQAGAAAQARTADAEKLYAAGGINTGGSYSAAEAGKNSGQKPAGADYDGQYADLARDMLNEIMGRKPYESRYSGDVDGLYGHLANSEPYESQYTDQIRGLYDQIQGRGEYESPWTAQIESLYDEIVNRPKFSYDPTKDPLYQQYREQYARGGQQAMRDTMGASAALTGGYGNSWGNTAGYQAYQNYMAALNDKIPELSQQAWERYQQEGADLKDRLSLAASMDERDYGRWQDAGNALASRLNTALAMDEQDYGRYMDTLSQIKDRLSTALAMDDADYQRYLQEDSDQRQNYAALVNADAQDWQKYMQSVQAAQNQAKLDSELRSEDLAYRQALGQMGALTGTGYMRGLSAEDIAALAAAGLTGAGTEATGGGSGDAGSGFDTREWQASRIGIKSGALNKNQSPLTTLGGKQAMDQWYANMYKAMDGTQQAKAGTAKTGSTGGTGSTLLDNLWKGIVNGVSSYTGQTQSTGSGGAGSGGAALTNAKGESTSDVNKRRQNNTKQ